MPIYAIKLNMTLKSCVTTNLNLAEKMLYVYSITDLMKIYYWNEYGNQIQSLFKLIVYVPVFYFTTLATIGIAAYIEC